MLSVHSSRAIEKAACIVQIQKFALLNSNSQCRRRDPERRDLGFLNAHGKKKKKKNGNIAFYNPMERAVFRVQGPFCTSGNPLNKSQGKKKKKYVNNPAFKNKVCVLYMADLLLCLIQYTVFHIHKCAIF